MVLGQTALAIDDKPFCYSAVDTEKIAKAFIDLKKCQIDVVEKDKVIKEHLILPDATQAGAQWWQEPAFVWGGIVVSASAATLVTWYLVRPK
jgi:hypothetical protein